METNVREIARDVYRISTFHPDFGIQFNQFLIKDDEPLRLRIADWRMRNEGGREALGFGRTARRAVPA